MVRGDKLQIYIIIEIAFHFKAKYFVAILMRILQRLLAKLSWISKYIEIGFLTFWTCIETIEVPP